jgi:hypothetical protein
MKVLTNRINYDIVHFCTLFTKLRITAMRILLILTLLAAGSIPLFAQDVKSDEEPQIMARITVTNAEDLQRIARLGLDLMEYREGDDLIFLTTQKQLDELKNAGWNVRIDEHMTAGLPRPGDTETFQGGYRTVEETFAFLNQMTANYPQLAQVFTYGQSWEKMRNPLNGYTLTGIKLTNRQISGPKPRIVIQAGIHARELVPPELATRFIQYLLSNYGSDGDATWILDEHEIYIIPLINPDGRKIAETGQMKRKNTNNLTGGCSVVSAGIDLNRNYSFWWGTVNSPKDPPCGETWPGLQPASEPEIQSMQALMTSLFPDQREPDRSSPAPLDATGVFLDMHSTGNLVLYPWGEDETPPPNPQFVTIAEKMASYNGYNPIQSIQLYPTSGTAHDWAYGELGLAGLGMETGLGGTGGCLGFMPQYICMDGSTNGNFWNLNRPVLLYLVKLPRTPFMTAEGPTPETFTATRTRLNRYVLRTQISDENNGGQNVTAAEFYLDTPPWRGGTPIPMSAVDGSFDSPVENAIGSVQVPGSHLVYVRGRDSAGNWGVMKGVLTSPRTTGGDN